MVKKHQERKIEILEKAGGLFYSSGYEHTSVQQIIDAVGIAKGTFYHYFESKTDLLDQLVRRMVDKQIPFFEDIIKQEGRNAIEKYNELAGSSLAWKVSNRKVLMAFYREIHNDRNVLMRHKMISYSAQLFGPLMAELFRQGMKEGLIDTDYPEEAAKLYFMLGDSLNKQLAGDVLALKDDPDRMPVIMRQLRMFVQAIERILGINPGSLRFFEEKQVIHLLLEEANDKG